MTRAVTVGLAALIVAPNVRAQGTGSSAKPAASAPKAKERTNKWVFGAHTIAAPGISITGPDIEGSFGTGLGGGLGIMAGYELNKAVTGYVVLDVARQGSGVNWMSGSFGLVHAEIGVRANLSKANPQMQPYLQAGLGKRSLGARITDFEDDEVYDLSLSGNMLSFGGGLQYVVSPKLSLDGGLSMAIGNFNTIDDDGDLGTLQVNSSTSIRLKAGVVWRP